MSTHRSKNCRTLIRTHVAGYLHELTECGYTASTREHYRIDLLRVIAYVEQKGISSVHGFVARVYGLLPNVSESKWARRGLRSTVNRFVEYLVRHGLVKDRTGDIPKTKYDRLAHEFVRFQIEHRGICPEYAKTVRRSCECFFLFTLPSSKF